MYERLDIIKEAEDVIINRQEVHGKPENSFAYISELWSGFLGKKIKPSGAALMMSLMKMGRLRNGSNVKDSYVDAIGYIAIAYELSLQEGSDE